MDCLTAAALPLALLGIAGLIVAVTALREVRALRGAVNELRSQLWLVNERLKQAWAGPAPRAEAAAAAVAEPVAPAAAAEAAARPAPFEAPRRPEAPVPTATAVTAVAPGPPPQAPAGEPAAAPSPAPVPGPPPTAPPPVRPAAPVSFEERFGARAFVWIGAVALALAGAFLVKYSVDQGWLGPAVRLALAILFGVTLLGAGEALHRRAGRIASGLAAAGIAVLFAAWLAGVNLYHLISPPLGFTFLALTAAAGVLLSLRQGMIVALVGLVGGFLTPALISSADPDPRVLFGYLLLLQVGLLAVGRRRHWELVSNLALAGGLLWVVGWLSDVFAPGDSLWLGLFLLGSLGASLWSNRTALAGGAEAETVEKASPALASLAATGALLTMALVTQRAGYTPLEWTFQALLTAAAMGLGRLRERLHGLAWLAAGTSFAILAVWGFDLPPEQEERFLWTALAVGALVAGGAYAAHFGARREGFRAMPARWTALAAVAGLAFFLLGWGSASTLRPALPWGALALGAAFLYLAAAVPLARRNRGEDAAAAAAAAGSLAGLAVAVTAFVSLAVPLELEEAWWTVAWAFEVPALVWLAGRFRLPALRRLAALLAAGVAVRLLANPEVLTYPIGTRPVFNWLLYGYGLPLLAVGGAAVLARRDRSFGPGRLAPGLEAVALGLAFALVTLEIRQLFQPAHLDRPDVGLVEWATYTVAWLLLALAALGAGRRLALPALCWGGRALLLAGAGGALLGSGLLGNPVWQHEPVGATPVANWLLWIYGLPAALAALAGRGLRRRGEVALGAAASVAALLCVFLLVSLEVRQAFHGAYLDGAAAGAAENYAYSAAWLLFGVGLLVLGIARRVRALRYASLAVMSLTVVKVFLYDTGTLTDLYRVLSFLGLGLALLLLAFLYQRFVFREPAG